MFRELLDGKATLPNMLQVTSRLSRLIAIIGSQWYFLPQKVLVQDLHKGQRHSVMPVMLPLHQQSVIKNRPKVHLSAAACQVFNQLTSLCSLLTSTGHDDYPNQIQVYNLSLESSLFVCTDLNKLENTGLYFSHVLSRAYSLASFFCRNAIVYCLAKDGQSTMNKNKSILLNIHSFYLPFFGFSYLIHLFPKLFLTLKNIA